MVNTRSAPTRPIQLSQAVWWYLAAIILFVLPVVLAIAFDRQIYHWYLLTFVVPKLETQLGFSSGEVAVSFPGSTPQRMFGITSVRADRPFAVAGFRAGDVPIGYVDAGFMEGFVTDIHGSLATGQPVHLSVVNAGERDQSGTPVRREIVFQPSKLGLQK